MHKELKRYLEFGETIELIYMNSNQQISRRKVRLISTDGDKIRGYCYTRHAPRTFMISNILAIGLVPAFRRKNNQEVI